MTKKGCTIDRVCGCYVDGNKNVVLKFSERFSDLQEEEFYKYLELAKKALSGSLGGNLLELHFQRGETGDEHQRYLYTLKASKLENPELLDRLYEKIIDSYAYAGNYLILVFHDIYDVISRTKDGKNLDESSEVYEYMIAAICPVEFSKPGLGYREEENRIGVCDRNWVVGAPDLGFTYPAFANHGTDSSAVMYYVKTGKDSHEEFVEDVLGCTAQRTAGEEKKAFRSVIQDSFEDPQQGESVFLKVQKHLSELTLPDPDAGEDEEMPPLSLTKDTFIQVMSDVQLEQEAVDILQAAFVQEFGDKPPTAQNVVDQKLVEESVQRIRTAELEDQVTDLKEQLTVKDQNLHEAKETIKAQEAQLAAGVEPLDDATVSLHVSPQKAKQIRTQLVGGVKCILVPLEKGESAQINGVPAEF
jgi:hypothetical protein